MATYYWVGGTGNIDGTAAHFAITSGGVPQAVVPGSGDDVIFDGNSGGGTVTVTVQPTWLTVDFTGWTGTLFTNGFFIIIVGTKCMLSSTMTTSATASAFSLNPTAGVTCLFTTAGKTTTSVTINGASTGVVSLQDALTVGTGYTLTLTAGTLNTNSFSVTCGNFSSSNSNTRTLTLGSSNITITSGSSQAFNTATATNLTITANTAVVTFTANVSSVTLLSTAGINYNGTSFTFTGGGTPFVSISSGTATFANLTYTGTASKSNTLGLLLANITVTNTFTVNGNSSTNRAFVQGSGGTRTITAAAVSMSNVDFMDITAAGAANWNLSAITGGSGDAGGNTGITFTTGQTNYWRGGTGNTSDVTHWANTSGGAASSGRVPLPQDPVVFDANSFSAASQVVSFDMPRSGSNHTWTGVTNTPAWAISSVTSVMIFGSVTWSSAMTRGSWVAGIQLFGRGTHTYTTAGIGQTSMSISAPGGGSYTLQDAFTSNGTFSHFGGTFDTGGFAMTCTTFASTGSNTRAITLGTSTVSLTSTTASATVWNVATTGLTLSATSSTLVLSTASSSLRSMGLGTGFAYGTITYTVAASTGTLQLNNGASINTLNVYGGARTLTLSILGHIIVNWNVFGTVGAVVTVNSGTAGTAATLTKTSGYITSDYVSVQDITGTGGATFYMGSRSTNVSGNTGLTFTDAPQRFWVGGTATWDATIGTKWAVVSGGTGGIAVPTASDDVYLDANSGAAVVTLWTTATVVCKNFINTGFTGSFVTASGSQIDISGTVLTLSSAATYSTTVGVWRLIAGSSTTVQVTFAGKTLTTFTVSSAIMSMQDAFAITGQLGLTAGGITTNNFALTCGTLSASNSNTRTLTFGSSSITVTGTGSAWNTAQTSGLTVTSSTSTIIFTGSGVSFLNGSTGGGTKSYYNLSFTGGGTMALTVGSAVMNLNNLTVTGTAAKTDSMQITAAGGITVTGILSLTGNSATNRLFVKTEAAGTSRTLTSAANSMSNVDFMDITGAGAANWNLSAITGSSGDAGGNSGITFTTGQTNYWVGGTGNWSDINHWANTSGGAGGTGRVPLPQGTARFDANSFTTSGRTVTNDMPRLAKDIDWTGVTNTPGWVNATTSAAFYGSLTLSSGMTWTAGSSAVVMFGRGSHTITMAGLTWANSTSINGPGGTYTMLDAFRWSSTLTFSVLAGTFDSAGFSMTGGALACTGSVTRAMNLYTSTVTLQTTGTIYSLTGLGTSATVNAANANFVLSSTSATARTFTGGGGTYGSLTHTATNAGSLTLNNGNTFGTLNVSGTARSLLLSATTTTTVTNWNVFGTAGNLITVASTVGGSTATLVKSDGIRIGSDYLSIQDIAATPATTTWYAGSHSVDVSGNSGWIFSDLVLVNGAQATEFDTGISGLVDVRFLGSQATESDTANSGTALLRPAGSEADESDTGITGKTLLRPAGSEADESDTPGTGTALLRPAGHEADESDTPNTGTTLLRPSGSQAGETDTGIHGSEGLVINLEPALGEPIDIFIPVQLTGYVDAVFPPPVPPINFPGLSDPTVAPTLVQDDSVDGHLPAGTYRYRYAAWKGSPAQATAPSPSSDITLVMGEGEPSFTHVWTADDFAGDEAHLPDIPYGLWKQIGTWTPAESGSLFLPAPEEDGLSNEIDYLIYDASNIINWGLWDAYGYHYPNRPLGTWHSYSDTGSFEAGTTYVLAVYLYEDDRSTGIGRSVNFEPLVQAVQGAGGALTVEGQARTMSAVSLTYPTIPGADGYLVYREEL